MVGARGGSPWWWFAGSERARPLSASSARQGLRAPQGILVALFSLLCLCPPPSRGVEHEGRDVPATVRSGHGRAGAQGQRQGFSVRLWDLWGLRGWTGVS